MSADYYLYTNRSFRRWAPFYDLIAMPLSHARGTVVELSEAKEGSKILDVCTGTGAQAFAFSKRGCETIGIDLSERMLKVARRKNKHKNVTLKVADATKIPFEDGYFDISSISMALHDLPYELRHQVLDEMRRVSRRIVVAEYNIPKNKFSRWFYTHLVSIYESKYFSDFAKRDLKELLQQHGWRTTKEAHALAGSIVVFVCEKI